VTRVSVVVPYFEDQHGLDLVLAGLERQDHAPHDVVVADDGSATAPDVGSRSYPVRVVRQPDRGFRAAAARNLGAAAASGDLLCFLDADTVPEPGYLAAVVAASASADLVVGRRRHADLRGFGPAELAGWFAGGEAPVLFDDPDWLREAYERTDDLRAAGDDAYRFVISAVLSVSRELFDAVGGFEEEFSAYGGEDWEFAHRCWLRGADFRHAPDAVAWHDGPDFAGRHDEAAALASRNVEGLTLARFVTDPACRGTGLVWDVPDVAVTLDDRGAAPADVVAAVRSVLRDTDAGVWLVHGGVDLQDPRVHHGEPPAAVLARARFRVELRAPLVLTGASLRELTDVAPARVGELLVRRTRDVARGEDGEVVDVPEACAEPPSGTDLQRLWGHEEHQRRPRFARP
jgi:GT2 family glycosyltransferase